MLPRCARGQRRLSFLDCGYVKVVDRSNRSSRNFCSREGRPGFVNGRPVLTLKSKEDSVSISGRELIAIRLISPSRNMTATTRSPKSGNWRTTFADRWHYLLLAAGYCASRMIAHLVRFRRAGPIRRLKVSDHRSERNGAASGGVRPTLHADPWRPQRFALPGAR